MNNRFVPAYARFPSLVAFVAGLLCAVICSAQPFQHPTVRKSVLIRAAVPTTASSDLADDPKISTPAPTTSTTRPATTLPVPTADFELHEWAIFVTEPLAPRANSTAVIKSTLPSFVVGRRTNAALEDRQTVMPIGLIRIIGGKTPSPKFDVLLNLRGGEFQGEWPKAEHAATRLLWNNLVADDAKPTLSQVDPKHWFERLRDGNSRYLTAGRDVRGERFLLYDAEPAFVLPLRVESAGENGYRVSNSSSFQPTNLEFYKSKSDRWHKALIASLPPSSNAKVSTQPVVAVTPKIRPGDGIEMAIEYSQNYGWPTNNNGVVMDAGEYQVPNIGTVPLGGRTVEQAEKDVQRTFNERGVTVSKVTITLHAKEEVVATTGPTGPASEVVLLTEAVSDPRQLLLAWKDRLAATGLTPVDTDLILDILAKFAVDPGRLTAIYMLDRQQMDYLLPEEVVPTPARTVRVGLAIVRNIDPAINEEIAALIKQLGDDEWAKRVEAQKKLTAFGRAAKGPLEKAAKDKDMEVVWRAEAILHAIDPMKFQGFGG